MKLSKISDVFSPQIQPCPDGSERPSGGSGDCDKLHICLSPTDKYF